MQAPVSTTFRQTLSRFTTGVCVITAHGEDTPHPIGMTINAFTSVSLDPPLILFCLKKDAKRTPAFLEAPCFSLNILAQDQEELSRHFAKEAALNWEHHGQIRVPEFPPFLKGATAHIACQPYAVHEAGDHFIVIAQVTHVDVDDTRPPLVYYASNYARLDTIPLALTRKAS